MNDFKQMSVERLRLEFQERQAKIRELQEAMRYEDNLFDRDVEELGWERCSGYRLEFVGKFKKEKEAEIGQLKQEMEAIKAAIDR